MSPSGVQDILTRIEQLSAEDRAILNSALLS